MQRMMPHKVSRCCSPHEPSNVNLPAAKRIRAGLLVINVLLILTGLLDLILGAFIASAWLASHGDVKAWHGHPPLWILGLPPLATGIIGLTMVRKRSTLTTSLWVVATLATNSGLFIYLYVSDTLNPDSYDISLHIFGYCSPASSTKCQCTWADGGFSSVLHSPCRRAWRTTVIYLVLVASFTLALSIEMVAVTLQLAYVVWLPRCLQANIGKDERDLYKIDTSYANTTYYGAETTSSLRENAAMNSAGHTPLLPRIPEVSPDIECHTLNATMTVNSDDVTETDVL